MPLRPVTILTALLCTFSRHSLSFSNHGDHAGEENSNLLVSGSPFTSKQRGDGGRGGTYGGG